MKEITKTNKQNKNLNKLTNVESNNLYPGYPEYSTEQDIYSKYQEEKNIDPEDISQEKKANNNFNPESKNEIDRNASGNDLDIPGSELDDEMEAIGCEDEENNYYSLGGDNHNDLDESQG
jgi:hypothetical protein